MSEEPDRDARTWATVAHLSPLAGLTGIPFANVIGPLVVWLIKRQDHPFVDDQGKEALNFQLSLTLYAVAVGLVLAPVLFIGALLPVLPGLVFVPVAIVGAVALLVFGLVMIVVAALRANEGEAYRYPLTIRFVRGRHG